MKDNLALAEKEKVKVQEKANVVDVAFARPESKGGGERLVPLSAFMSCMEGVNTMAIKADLTTEEVKNCMGNCPATEAGEPCPPVFFLIR